MLQGKTVVLGVTGSIAAYKIANLASMLVKLHADVHVIMTKNAVNFINPITFETLTGNKCLVDTFDRIAHRLVTGDPNPEIHEETIKDWILNGYPLSEMLGDIWDINDTPTKEEFENAFVKVEKAKTSSGFVDKPAAQMNGRLTRRKPCRILHLKMDAAKLREVDKSYGATVTANQFTHSM